MNLPPALRFGVATVLLAGPAPFAPAAEPKPVADYRNVVKITDVEIYSRAALSLRKWMIEHDPHRPIYHFTGPESWINDPNGPICHKGKYHLFFQFDPMVSDEHGGSRRSARCWGHAVSDDLVHWVDWPVAMWPDTPYDRGGVYSGNTVIDDQGFPCALYTGNVGDHAETYGMLARSTDGWRTWQKTMVMDNRQRPNADSPVHWDGQTWREGDRWCQLIGGTTRRREPPGCSLAVDLNRSQTVDAAEEHRPFDQVWRVLGTALPDLPRWQTCAVGWERQPLLGGHLR